MTTAKDELAGESPLSREQVLDELELLAGVEHALCVEYLSIHCALGHDQSPTGDVAERVHDVALAFSSFAQDEMRFLHHVNEGLVAAGRSPQLGRAASIAQASGPDIPLVPASPAEMPGFIDRARAIATAVDARYARLRPALAAPLFEGDVLGRLLSIFEPMPDHGDAVFASLRTKLDGLTPAHYLQATHRDPAGALEEGLLSISDRYYGLTVDMVATWFAHEDDFGLAGAFRGLSQSCMQGLNDANALLVRCGLLPTFTPPH